jgi:SAM-dependent methyltransferase
MKAEGCREEPTGSKAPTVVIPTERDASASRSGGIPSKIALSPKYRLPTGCVEGIPRLTQSPVIIAIANIVKTAIFSLAIFGLFIAFSGCEKKPLSHDPPPPAGPVMSPELIPRNFFRSKPDEKALGKYKKMVSDQIASGKSVSDLFFQGEIFAEYLRVMPISATDVIGDIGCGTGLFESAILEERIPFKNLYAVDIDKTSLDFLNFLMKSSKAPGAERIQSVHSTMSDVHLPTETLDIAVVINTSAFNATRSPDGEIIFSGNGRQCLVTLIKAMKNGASLHYFWELSPTENPDSKELDLIAYSFVSEELTLVSREIMTVQSLRSIHVVFKKF